MTAEVPFDRIVLDHRSAVLHVCCSILRDDHLGADAAQDTFVRLWRQLQRGVRPERFGAWLRRVAVTTAIDVARRHRADSVEALDHEPQSSADAPDRLSSGRELQDRLEQELARLPEAQRTVFCLRHFGGLSLREVADALDVGLPTAKTHFARACLRLQSSLRAFRPESDS